MPSKVSKTASPVKRVGRAAGNEFDAKHNAQMAAHCIKDNTPTLAPTPMGNEPISTDTESLMSVTNLIMLINKFDGLTVTIDQIEVIQQREWYQIEQNEVLRLIKAELVNMFSEDGRDHRHLDLLQKLLCCVYSWESIVTKDRTIRIRKSLITPQTKFDF
jgi:hypothetical protein